MFILKGSIELGRGGDRAWRATECTWRHQKKLSSYVKTKHQTKPGNNNVLTLLRASSSIKREKQQQKKVNQPNCCCSCRWSKISVSWSLQWTSYRRTRKRQVGRCLTSLSKAGKSGITSNIFQIVFSLGSCDFLNISYKFLSMYFAIHRTFVCSSPSWKA